MSGWRNRTRSQAASAGRHGAEPAPVAGATRPKPRLTDPPDGTRGYMSTGLALVALLAGGLLGWASSYKLAGAVIAPGTVVVETNVKKVQHPTGGIVGEIRVRNGDRVRAGDIVVRLDETITRSNLQVVTRQLNELAVRQARLRAERDGKTTVDLPAEFVARAGEEAQVEDSLAGERNLFQSRKVAREGQRAQLRERVAQLRDEIEGLVAQEAAKASEIALLAAELKGQRDLWENNLIPITKYMNTQREAARVEGERGRLVASIAQAKGRIAEIELQIIQIDQDLRSEVVGELREAQAKEAELLERRVAAEDQLRRVDIRAPQDGIVHQLSVHTVGGVITPSEPVMLIVPGGDKLDIEARIAPEDIDHVRPSGPAVIRFPAFSHTLTPEFNAVVHDVSADLVRDAQNNVSYYVARLTLAEEDLAQAGALQLMPGMPAEVQIKTVERTALSYFLKPLRDQLAKAFKED